MSLAINPARGVVEVKGASDNTWLTAKGAQATKYWEKYRLVHGEAARVQDAGSDSFWLSSPFIPFIPAKKAFLVEHLPGSRCLLNTLQGRSTTSLRQDSRGSR